jgi:K+-sensing histidine kinase KdpD
MTMDFSDMLASSIHDIKNSLTLISTKLSETLHDEHNRFADPRQVSLLEHQVQRVNHNLVQLLSLYKMGEGNLGVDIDEHNIEELFIECVANNHQVCVSLGLELSYECDADLMAFFDLELVRSVIDSTIGNAQRYAESRILLSARKVPGFVVLRVEDDGKGFPQELMQRDQSQPGAYARGSYAANHTNLGLLFAEKVSSLHRSNDRHGRIEVKNACHLPGACVEIWLP